MTKFERIIVTSAPVAFVAKKSKKIALPGFHGVPLYDVVVFFIGQIRKASVNSRAKSISYDFAMAIPAVLICIFTIIPYLPISKQFTRELLTLTRAITPNQNSYNFVNSFLQDFLNTPRVGLLSFGFILVIFYASNAMMSIIKTFDYSIYNYKPKINCKIPEIESITYILDRSIEMGACCIIVLLQYIVYLQICSVCKKEMAYCFSRLCTCHDLDGGDDNRFFVLGKSFRQL